MNSKKTAYRSIMRRKVLRFKIIRSTAISLITVLFLALKFLQNYSAKSHLNQQAK